MCVISTLDAAPGGHSVEEDSGAVTTTTTVIKGTNENETVKSAKSLTSSSSRSKKANLKSTPITYITSLADVGHHQHYAKPPPKKYGKTVTKVREDKEAHQHQHQHQHKKAKHHHSEKSTGKSLEVMPKKEPLTNPTLLRWVRGTNKENLWKLNQRWKRVFTRGEIDWRTRHDRSIGAAVNTFGFNVILFWKIYGIFTIEFRTI